MPVQQVLIDQRVPVKIWTHDVDERSKEQLANIAGMPFIHHHVTAMPDIHFGLGATIGSVIATHKAIIPAAVGADIGCGMVAARLSITSNDLDDKSLKKVFDQITRDVPVGRGQHIVAGKGNPDSFCSSAHGAGRRMSRTAAEKCFTEVDLIKQTAGVICRKDKGVLDEIPGAYKDIDQVMADQNDLTEILHSLSRLFV